MAVSRVPMLFLVYQMLMSMKGIGHISAFALTVEGLGWRTFANTREVGASAGLAPTPHCSDQTHREQGINKAARSSLRSSRAEFCSLVLLSSASASLFALSAPAGTVLKPL